MIELIFSDSGAAALAMAKSPGKPAAIHNMEITTDTQGNETIRELPVEPYYGPAVEGDASDIAALWLLGDVGDISDLSDWSSRLKILREISHTDALETDEWVEEEAVRAHALVARLEQAAEAGEPIRIWWSDLAHETCGYYWAMHLLKNANGPITSVKVPRIWLGEDRLTIVNGTGELEPEAFASLLTQERTVEPAERKSLAHLWEKLVSENAPLRAVLNGVPYSVPEDFYDYLLRRAFPAGEFPVIEAIGRALGRGPGGIGDWWFAYRLRHMIAQGELEVVIPNPKFYSTIIRKAAQ